MPLDHTLQPTTPNPINRDLKTTEDITSSLTTASVYHSAYNVFDRPPNLKKQSSEEKRSRVRHASVPDSGQFKLLQAKMSIDHFLMDLTFEGN